MRSLTRSSRIAAAITGCALLGGLAVAAVIPRDLPKQLQLIDVKNGGIVVYGEITNAQPTTIQSGEQEHPYTILTVKVDDAVAPTTTSGSITVYSPGSGDYRFSISPPEAETRVGEKVFFFLRVDESIRALNTEAYKLDSFAESFRTQSNRKGEVIVLGEGSGSAIESNTQLAQLKTTVQSAYEIQVNANGIDNNGDTGADENSTKKEVK